MSESAGFEPQCSGRTTGSFRPRVCEKEELATDPKAEEEELAGIYRRRGLELELARTVARRLMTQSPLAAHARDELGRTGTTVG